MRTATERGSGRKSGKNRHKKKKERSKRKRERQREREKENAPYRFVLPLAAASRSQPEIFSAPAPLGADKFRSEEPSPPSFRDAGGNSRSRERASLVAGKRSGDRSRSTVVENRPIRGNGAGEWRGVNRKRGADTGQKYPSFPLIPNLLANTCKDTQRHTHTDTREMERVLIINDNYVK